MIKLNTCWIYLLHIKKNFLFTGDGRWRQVIRRCASVSDTGVTGVCNWGVYLNGDYWEECYCSEDECNSSNFVSFSWCLVAISGVVVVLRNILWVQQTYRWMNLIKKCTILNVGVVSVLYLHVMYFIHIFLQKNPSTFCT